MQWVYLSIFPVSTFSLYDVYARKLTFYVFNWLLRALDGRAQLHLDITSELMEKKTVETIHLILFALALARSIYFIPNSNSSVEITKKSIRLM